MKRFHIYYHNRYRRKSEMVGTFREAMERVEFEAGKVTVIDTLGKPDKLKKWIFQEGRLVSKD